MATEVSAAEQTTDGQIEEKKVIDDPKVLEGENVYCDKETGGIGESNGLKVEEQVHHETASTDTRKAAEDGNDEVHTAEEKEEHDDAKPQTSGGLQDKKDDVPAVVDVKETVEDVKASGSEASANSDIAENAKEKDETSKISSLEVAEAEKGEKTEDATESLSEAVENVVVEPEISPVQHLEQVGQQKEVTEPVTEIAKATEESSGNAADTGLASETVEEKGLSAIEPATDAPAEVEKKDETHAVDEVLEVSKDEKVLATEVEITCDVSKEEPDVKESGNASAPLVLDNDAVSEKTKEASDDYSAGGLSLMKELAVDPSLPKPSTVEGEAEPIDNSVVAEPAQSAVKPEIKVESQQEETLAIKPVEEQKEETIVEAEASGVQKGRKTLEAMLAEEQEGDKNVETVSAEEQKEEKTLKEIPTVIAGDKSGDLRNPADKASKTDTEAKKISEGADKIAEELDPGASDSAVKTIEVPTEKDKASEAAEAPKDESSTNNLTHPSRDIDPEAKKDAVDTFIKELVETTVAGDAKDETEDKNDEAKGNDTQRLVESSKEDPSSKTEVEAQKSETSAKSKTLISKLKRSILKVKKAMIGKPPSQKIISAESKDASEVRDLCQL